MDSAVLDQLESPIGKDCVCVYIHIQILTTKFSRTVEEKITFSQQTDQGRNYVICLQCRVT